MLKRVIDKDTRLSSEDHEELLDLIAERLELQNQITERWTSDNASGSWLASNVRPLIVLLLVFTLLLFIALGAAELGQAILYYDTGTNCFFERLDPHDREQFYAGQLRARLV